MLLWIFLLFFFYLRFLLNVFFLLNYRFFFSYKGESLAHPLTFFIIFKNNNWSFRIFERILQIISHIFSIFNFFFFILIFTLFVFIFFWEKWLLSYNFFAFVFIKRYRNSIFDIVLASSTFFFFDLHSFISNFMMFLASTCAYFLLFCIFVNFASFIHMIIFFLDTIGHFFITLIFLRFTDFFIVIQLFISFLD